MAEAGDVEYGMVMPFVTVASKGGPHDDASFVAGYECGQIDHLLLMTDEQEVAMMVHSDSMPQVDLIAMMRRFTVETVSDDHGWAHIVLRRSGIHVGSTETSEEG